MTINDRLGEIAYLTWQQSGSPGRVVPWGSLSQRTRERWMQTALAVRTWVQPAAVEMCCGALKGTHTFDCKSRRFAPCCGAPYDGRDVAHFATCPTLASRVTP